MPRKEKDRGFGQIADDSTPSTSDKIYSMPPLYDLAFGYRDYEGEVDFLLDAHDKHAKRPQSQPRSRLNILELAAGPARHSLAALSQHSPSEVESATALDRSHAMVKYGLENADHELGAPGGGRRDDFSYASGDMRSVVDFAEGPFDTAWLLLGSMQHLLSNADIVACLSSIHSVLKPGGTVFIELPHPRELFSMGECTRSGWVVPLVENSPDGDGEETEYGELNIVWGDEDDAFDPVLQIRHFTVRFKLAVNDVEALPIGRDASPMFAHMSNDGKYELKEIVPMRIYTLQEIDALARCTGFDLEATYGALAEVCIEDEEAFRMVCVLRKE